jgi:hypothetical protein
MRAYNEEIWEIKMEGEQLILIYPTKRKEMKNTSSRVAKDYATNEQC